MELYEKKICTENVSGLELLCSECKVTMTATGNLFKRKPPLSGWVVEYKCPKCKDLFRIRDSTKTELVLKIVGDIENKQE